MISQASQSQDHFARTRWSVVMQFAEAESPLAREALVELSRRYWYPAYTYLRCCGREPAAAQEMAGDLLHRLLDKAGSGARTGTGHYRQFLLAELRAYVAGDRDLPPVHSSTPEAPSIAELEARYQRDSGRIIDPERAFQHSFALVVLQRTLHRLRQEAIETGHLEMYRALQPWLVREPHTLQLEALAARLRLRHVAVVLALKRLRQRLRELAADELADTVGSADDLIREQEALLAILDEPPS
jgi:hypothetical protein